MKLSVPWDAIDALIIDVFGGALLCRVPEPRDLFVLVEAALARTDGARFHDFSTVRLEAEREQVEGVRQSGHGADAGLAGVYEILARIRPDWSADTSRLMALECETMSAVSIANPAVLATYGEALKRGKAVAFLLGNVVPQFYAETTLRKCGYEGELFMIGDVEGGDGGPEEMLVRTASTLNVDPGRIACISGEPLAAGVSAQPHWVGSLPVPRGIKHRKVAVTRPRRRATPPIRDGAGDVLHRGLVETDASIRFPDQPESDRRVLLGRIGYSVLGPVLAGFTQWLAASVGETPGRLHFVSRDGWLLKVAFEKYARVHDIVAEPRYLYASRRSLKMATLSDEPKALRELLRQLVLRNKGASLAQYCDFLGIAPPDAEELGQIGLPSAEVRMEGPSLRSRSDSLRQRSEAFFEARAAEIARRAARERAAYLDYLADEHLLDGGTATLVDCGWFGSTQRHLKELIEEVRPGTAVRGYFLGTARGANAKQPACSEMTGYLYHEGNGINRPREFVEAARLLELFLKTDQSPFYCMEPDPRGGTRPVFGGACEADPDLEHLQAEALRFVDDWLALVPAAGVAGAALRPSSLRAAIAELLGAPTADQARALGGMAYATDPLSDESASRFAMPTLSTWEMLSRPELRRREVKASGSRHIYEMLSPSALSRLLVRLTPVDDHPVTPVHALARRAKVHLKRARRA
ncbi:hypothetical protein [Jannaschia sp. W003]|uniref:hypothetical protein n=1 Tax=Jannaschia sp. W003 TaxID=2867012 RepID=UPI0021A669D9|nr:hypothetical protein [Jannaschia sp. W003]UWQ23187.1 hypothetical protein K3554_16740 [Jannaschia sp. W003]